MNESRKENNTLMGIDMLGELKIADEKIKAMILKRMSAKNKT